MKVCHAGSDRWIEFLALTPPLKAAGGHCIIVRLTKTPDLQWRIVHRTIPDRHRVHLGPVVRVDCPFFLESCFIFLYNIVIYATYSELQKDV